MTAAPLLLLALNLARADDAPVVAATPQLVVRKQGRRVYPRRIYDDLGVVRRCTVEVTVDERGRASYMTPVDCPPELVEHTRRRVRKDRWVRPVPEDARGTVVVTYVPEVDTMELPAPDYWRRRSSGACGLRVSVDPQGRVTLREAGEEGCAPAPQDWAPLAEGVLRGKVPEVCPVTFVVIDGRARDLDLFRCDLRLWRTVRAGLVGWTWPASDRPRSYAGIVQLDGPRDGAGAGVR